MSIRSGPRPQYVPAPKRWGPHARLRSWMVMAAPVGQPRSVANRPATRFVAMAGGTDPRGQGPGGSHGPGNRRETVGNGGLRPYRVFTDRKLPVPKSLILMRSHRDGLGFVRSGSLGAGKTFGKLSGRFFGCSHPKTQHSARSAVPWAQPAMRGWTTDCPGIGSGPRHEVPPWPRHNGPGPGPPPGRPG